METIKHLLTAQNLAVAFAAWCVLVTGAASIVASLINVLTPYPKIETWLHRVQDRLAFLQHFDSSPTLLGILQWPLFQKSNPPGVIGQPVAKASGFACLGLLLVMCVLSLCALAGCAWFQKSGGPALVQCSEAQIAPILSDVENILLQSSPEWQTELGAVAAVHGEDAALCAVQKWVTSWMNPGAADIDPRVATALRNGQRFLKDSGKVVAGS